MAHATDYQSRITSSNMTQSSQERIEACKILVLRVLTQHSNLFALPDSYKVSHTNFPPAAARSVREQSWLEWQHNVLVHFSYAFLPKKIWNRLHDWHAKKVWSDTPV